MAIARKLRVLFALSLAACLLLAGPGHAGGPLLVRSTGAPFAWSTASAIQYRTGNGPLSASVDEPTARQRVSNMFRVWQDVPTANISYSRAGSINATGAFTGGDVDTVDEYNAIEADCGNGNQSPVVYDADGTIFTELSIDVDSVIGFAGPCAFNNATEQWISGQVVMNGLLQDGAPAPDDITMAKYDAAIIHEIGHFSGLDHSQINVNCIGFCGADDLAGLPTMFPLLVDASQAQLSIDDIAWISRLYPENMGTTFASTHGTISGVVFFSDGQSHAQLVNVIARRVDTGANEDRRNAISVVSGYKFTIAVGNPIVDFAGSPFGTRSPGDIGLFEIPVPAGSYTVEVETIDPGFTEGSSVGGPLLIPMPGIAPQPIGPIAVGAGATASGNNVTLIGTDPRFDQFEGP